LTIATKSVLPKAAYYYCQRCVDDLKLSMHRATIMVDTIDVDRRSENMRLIRSADTKPELLVRRLVYSLGIRYRLHRKDLPGCPDLVFTSRRKVIFVHGCFWHQHQECRDGRPPRSKTEYWLPKLARNIERDGAAITELKKMGWRVLVIWECELSNSALIKRTSDSVGRFLIENPNS
jgi:DNA mismatch endonuclease (patch repair protein)